MTDSGQQMINVALVYGTLPSIEEVDQFQLLDPHRFRVTVLTSESICGYLTQNSTFQDLTCMALPDHDEDTTFLPGLEQHLKGFDLVIVKGRIGVYAYQAVKARWRHQFRLLVWVDNLQPFAGEDVNRMRTIRDEITNNADGFLVQTEACRQTLLTEGISSERIIMTPPWVGEAHRPSKKEKAQAKSRLGLAEGTILIGYVGQIEWEERLLDLVHGAYLAMEEDETLARRLKIVCSGIGNLGPQLRGRALKLGCDELVNYIKPTRESYQTLYQAADMLFVSGEMGRDRIDGDGYRILRAIKNHIPVVANRTPLTEELLDKHRLDWCLGSSLSLSRAIKKAATASNLVHNIQAKLLIRHKQAFEKDAVAGEMDRALSQMFEKKELVGESDIEHRISEIAAKIASKQYLVAVDLIDGLFGESEIQDHQRSELFRMMGDCFAKLGDLDAAKDAYVKATEFDSFSAKPHIGLGTLSLMKSNYDIAVLQFQKAFSLDPNDEMATLGMGLTFQGLDQLGESNKWIVKSLQINQDNTAAIYALVRLAYDREEYHDAEETLSRYVARHPEDHDLVYSLAGVLYKMGRYEEVADVLDDIIQQDPLDSRAQSLIKQARRAMNRRRDQMAETSSM